MSTTHREIAVIDDDLDILDLISAHFRAQNYRVHCFSDVEEALAELPKSNWDALVTDLQLPVMSGVEVTLRVHEHNPDLPVILVTNSKSAEVAIEAIQKGAYDFIVKPIHFSQLQLSIERAVRLKDLKKDLVALRERVKDSPFKKSGIIGKSPRFLEALDTACRVAKSSANIFVCGESGTGKEVVARLIHSESQRTGPFVAINCSAIPENLLESELFGHAKGAFTGAQHSKSGLFEEAQEGTLFLDEIGDLSLSLQAKLLRVLQERKIKRVGENQEREITCRIISATHRNLVEEVSQKRFREDLFFRLNVIPISLPPLRERHEDIIPLAESFLKQYALENGSVARTFSQAAVRYLLEFPWRGNVRELANLVERAVVLATSPEIPLASFLPSNPTIPFAPETKRASGAGAVFSVVCDEHRLPTLEEVLNQYVAFAVDVNEGARDRTAKEIGIDRKTLYKRLNFFRKIQAPLRQNAVVDLGSASSVQS